MTVTSRWIGALIAGLALAVAVPALAAADPATPAQVGRWGSVLQWPLQAKHMILLQTGEVLVWASQANADPHLWDPVADPTGANMRPVPFPAGDLHCAAQVTLADGRVLVVGGQNVDTHIGIPVTAIFDPVTETWTRGRDMHFARWYPTLTVLADGRVMVSSGDQPDGTGGYVRVTTPEIYDPSTDTWTDAAQPVTQQYLYPFMYQLPGGSVFEAGTRYQTQFFTPGAAGASGTWAAGRSAPFSTDSYSESGVMYAPGKILRTGGGDPAQDHTAVIDTNVADPTKAQWRLTAPMNHARRRMNTPLLLDGTVLAVGGTTVGNNPAYAVRTSEIWDPATERWTDAAPLTDPRMYHSTALTLPDGRVVSAGGQVTAAGATEDAPTSTSLQTTAEVYGPPYLFKGPRPAIASAPARSGYGAALPITLGDATTTVVKVALLRPSGVTHAIDMDQRYVPLDFTQSGATVTATTPSSPYRAVPGWYMLVVVDAGGVPSVASWVLLGTGAAVQAPGSPAPIAPAATVAATATITALTPTVIAAGDTVDFASSWTGPPTSFAWTFGDGGTSGAAHPSHRFTAPGHYTVGLTVKNARTPQGSASNTLVVDVVAGGTGTGTGTGDPGTGTGDPGTGGSGTTTPPPAAGPAPAPAPAPAPGPELPGPAGPVAGPATATSGVRSRQTFTAVAHASVASRGAASTAVLRLGQGRGPAGISRRAFVSFDVSGLGAAPARAVLRLRATDGSTDGGSVFAVGTGWAPAGLSWTSAPSITGASLASAGATTRRRWVELDVTRAVTGDGRVSFGLASTSADTAAYATAGAGAPELVITPATVAAAPAADLDAAPRSGTGPLTVAFTDRSVGATSWAWDFQGDGTVDSTQRNPRFTYTRPGTYEVRLTARNDAGADVATLDGRIVVAAAGAAGATRRFAPVADGSISSLRPRATAGAARTLGVRQGVTGAPETLRSYLRFHVAGVRGVPASARLRLYVARASSDGGSVFPVTSRWTERGLSWSTAPGLTLPSLASAGPTAAGTWIDLDVTRGVAGDGDVSFVLSGTAAQAAAYAAREDAAHRPQLVITSARGTTARQARVRRAHLASLLAPRPSLVCPLGHDGELAL
ncbi:DNRLRE domain-containing protein [Baekduia soli]|uniref:DNRLRE domain-containing protein n=1 Tax=Baekduia soli TaxID=496014 RepID=A0A5B8U995_9ACTN|nr:DNRLRE domain-containing protein [Baekduia soli]QEC49733.1 DNRLRE domain-containing protein [Baekduia soli]